MALRAKITTGCSLLITVILWANMAGADLNKDFYEAARRGDLPEVKSLLSQGADINWRFKTGFTPLMAAIHNGHWVLAKFLIAKGANVNAQARLTPLMLASKKGQREIVGLLLAKGADVNAKSPQGATSLMSASGRGSQDVVKLLLAKGANVNAKTKEGWTALMGASRDGHSKVVKLLLAAGADVNARDDKGRTALTFANRKGPPLGYLSHGGPSDDLVLKRAEEGRKEVRELLVRAGAE